MTLTAPSRHPTPMQCAALNTPPPFSLSCLSTPAGAVPTATPVVQADLTLEELEHQRQNGALPHGTGPSRKRRRHPALSSATVAGALPMPITLA